MNNKLTMSIKIESDGIVMSENQFLYFELTQEKEKQFMLKIGGAYPVVIPADTDYDLTIEIAEGTFKTADKIEAYRRELSKILSYQLRLKKVEKKYLEQIENLKK